MPVEAAPEIGANAPLTTVEYFRLAEAGAFGDLQTELIDGGIVLKVSHKRLHYRTIKRAMESLAALKPKGLYADTQGTTELTETDAPQPDVFLTREDPDVSTKEIVADDLLLAVEVAVTTLREDRKQKAPMYARAGIPDYWIVNPVARQVEVYRTPQSGVYTERTVYGMGEGVSPLAAPDHLIAVASLMPPLDPATR